MHPHNFAPDYTTSDVRVHMILAHAYSYFSTQLLAITGSALPASVVAAILSRQPGFPESTGQIINSKSEEN